MNFQPHDTRCVCSRKAEYVSEGGIQRYEYPAVFDRKAPDFLIGSS